MKHITAIRGVSVEDEKDVHQERQTLEYRIAHGDPSAWLNWGPEYIDANEMLDAWEEPLRRRGEPGFPDTFHFYTHFAYCRQSCSFCMYWHRVPQEDENYKLYSDYIIERLTKFRERYGRTRISNAYFGGGTPTAMPLPYLKKYFETVKSTFDVSYEFTVECHPLTISDGLLEVLHDAGVNRISMGIQSTDKAVLKNIVRRNRPYEEITEFVQGAQAKDIACNLDLCIGLPGQNREGILKDLQIVTSAQPSRITLYPFHPVKSLPVSPPEDLKLADLITDTSAKESTVRPFDQLAEEAGYSTVSVNRYQAILIHPTAVSPRKKPSGAKTNYVCFEDSPSHLIGVGPASFNHIFGHNWSREVTHLDALSEKNPVFVGTRLSHEDEGRQMLLRGLGGLSSFDINQVSDQCGVDLATRFAPQLEEGINRGFLTQKEKSIRLSSDLEESERLEYLQSFIPKKVRELKNRELETRPNVERELLATRREKRDPKVTEAVNQWREILGVPLAGRKFGGVWVSQVDDASVSFGVEGRNEPPLRVFIKPRGKAHGFVKSAKFVVSYSNRNLTEKEKQFLHRLAEQTLKKDPPFKKVAQPSA